MATCSPSELLEAGKCFQCLSKKELQIAIAQLLCEIQAGGGGGATSPKVYRAMLSQSGTDAPVPTVLENTLGEEVVWSRDSEGLYFGNISGGFLANKTFLSSTSNRSWDGNIFVVSLDIANGKINLQTYSHDNPFSGRDNWGNYIPIEILVYP